MPDELGLYVPQFADVHGLTLAHCAHESCPNQVAYLPQANLSTRYCFQHMNDAERLRWLDALIAASQHGEVANACLSGFRMQHGDARQRRFLSGVELRKVLMNNSHLENVSFRDCRFRAGTVLSGSRFVSCDLAHSYFDIDELYNIRFENCNLRNTYFAAPSVARIHWPTLRKFVFDGVLFEDVDLTGAFVDSPIWRNCRASGSLGVFEIRNGRFEDMDLSEENPFVGVTFSGEETTFKAVTVTRSFFRERLSHLPKVSLTFAEESPAVAELVAADWPYIDACDKLVRRFSDFDERLMIPSITAALLLTLVAYPLGLPSLLVVVLALVLSCIFATVAYWLTQPNARPI